MEHDNDNELPRTRAEAKEKGLRHYFTGKPCRNKHVANRKASTGNCVQCDVESYKRSYEKNKDKIIKAAQEWYRANKKRKAATDLARYHAKPAVRQQNKEWRERNPDKVKAYREKWVANNPDKHREVQRNYTANNPEAVQANVRKRRARLRNSDGAHTASDIAAILERQRYRCAECGVSVKKRGDRQVDHIMPLKLGGSNNPSNLQILCNTCNKVKGAKHPVDFAQERGRLV